MSETYSLLMLWRDLFIALAWLVAVVFLISGLQDVVYDLWGYGWRLYRRVKFRQRTRLTLERLRLRAQQRIAVFVPAWQEAEVVNQMVENILHRVDYRLYTIFVGTYPNDIATQRAVDVLAAAHSQVVKVVTARPGPTNKADCLNTLYQAVKEYERQHDLAFDIIVMHDAEDVVHPYSFLLYNYLLPRVDVVQLPILPLPVPPGKFVHWTYADEFAENHMKDIIVREKMGGFVPYAGVGTGFSRRAFLTLEQHSGGELFNESSMTEDYSMSKRTHDAGLQSIFVNLVLGDDPSPWWLPLCRRTGFIANWSYFPMDFARAVRQKTRWIYGISLQEWEHTGWLGNWRVRENLVKDRKIFLSASTTLLGYSVFTYFIIYELGRLGLVPFQWEPIIWRGTLLYDIVLIDTGLMLLRLFQRMAFVSAVYGVAASLLSIIRIFYGNVINGLAAYHALRLFFASRRGRTVPWDKTDHQEGVGGLPADGGSATLSAPEEVEQVTCVDFLTLLSTAGPWETVTALEAVNPDCHAEQRDEIAAALVAIPHHADHHVRAVAARVLGRLQWPELLSLTKALLYDREWVVRANAADALLQFSGFAWELDEVFSRHDPYAWEVLIHSLESDTRALDQLVHHLDAEELAVTKSALFDASQIVRDRYAAVFATPIPLVPE
jgi:adsorption protein B